MSFLNRIANCLVGFNIEEMQSSVEALNKKVSILKNELLIKETALDEKVHKMRQIQGKVLSLTNKVDKLSNTITDLASQNDALVRDKSQLQDKFQEKCVEYHNLNGKMADLASQKDTILRSNEQLREQFQEKCDENGRLNDTIADLTSQNDVQNKGNLQLKEQLQEKSVEISSLKDTVTDLASQNDDLLKENSQLQGQFQEKCTENEKLNDTITELVSQKEDAVIYKQQLQGQFQERCAENEALKSKVDELENQVANKQSSESVEKRFLEDRIQTLEEKIAGLESAKGISDAEILRKEEEIKQIKEELEKAREENSALSDEVRNLREQKISIQQSLSEEENEAPKIDEFPTQEKSLSDSEEDTEDSIPNENETPAGGDSSLLSIPEFNDATTNQHDEGNETTAPSAQEYHREEDNRTAPVRRTKVKLKEDYVLELAKDDIEDFPPINNEQGHAVHRAIEYVNDENSNVIYADTFFNNSTVEEIARVSRKLSEVEVEKTGGSYYTCGMCHRRVKIAHRLYNGIESLFFIHADKEPYCPWKKQAVKSSDTTLVNVEIEETTEEDVSPNNNKPHSREVKEKMFSILTSEESQRMGITDVRIDTIVKGNSPYMRWRRPDISFMYGERQMVIELQRRNTPLDTIVDKDIFYRLNNVHVLWVFGSDAYNTYDYLRLSNYKNTMFANHRNVFVFDQEAIEASEVANVVKLKCNWLDEDDNWAINLKENNSNGKLIDFSQLTFDDDLCKPYYHDANREYFAKYPGAETNYLDSIVSKEQLKKKIEEKWTRNPNYEDAIRLMHERGDRAIVFKLGDAWGFCYNKTPLIQPIFTTEPQLQKNGYYKVRFNGTWGIVDRYGQKVVDWEANLRYDDIVYDSTSNRLLVYNGHNWGVTDIKGNLLIPFQYQSIDTWTSDMFRVRKDNKWGLCGIDGKLYAPCVYYKIYDLQVDHAVAEITDANGWHILRGKIRADGSPIIEKQELQKDGSTAFYQFERWGLMNALGQVIIEPSYELISYWGANHLFMVKTNNQWGIVDAGDGHEVLPAKYDKISPITNGRATAVYIGQEISIDITGKEVSQEEIRLQDGLCKVKTSGKWGVTDAKGKEIVPCLYDEIGSFRGRLIGIINKHVVKLAINYNYPINLSGNKKSVSQKGYVIDIAGVSCYLSKAPIEKMTLPHPLFDTHGCCKVLVFANIIFTDNKYLLRVCFGESLKKQLSHGDKEEDFAMGETLRGTVTSVKKYRKAEKNVTTKVIVAFDDGRISMVPRRFFAAAQKNIEDYPPKSPIILKKTGYDDGLDQTTWEILDMDGITK